MPIRLNIRTEIVRFAMDHAVARASRIVDAVKDPTMVAGI